ncbi:hypothetical protein EJ06DRAFT_389365 [Trichodelitschia bisporula]|uniref:Rhodopsin domain-containing protein n=1 Tax=Trichodelitschia bisporula TaxID=703511 RepID=A0A6G1HZX1_9PEZI|nr:hypothetical protein EJ06DRAFT_389365 [Trichodelitschia bisporula]
MTAPIQFEVSAPKPLQVRASVLVQIMDASCWSNSSTSPRSSTASRRPRVHVKTSLPLGSPWRAIMSTTYKTPSWTIQVPADAVLAGRSPPTFNETNNGTAGLTLPLTLTPDHDQLVLYYCVTTPFFALALIFYGLRMYTRLRPVCRLTWSDITLSFGVLCAIVQWSLVVAASLMFSCDVNESESTARENGILSAKLSFPAVPIWMVSTGCIKVSVILLLMQLHTGRSWRIGLRILCWTVIIVMVIGIVTLLTTCIPIQASWNIALFDQACWSADAWRACVFALSSVYIAQDVICALLPLPLIRSLARPKSEKIVIGILMMFGLGASACCIARLYSMKDISPAAVPSGNAIRGLKIYPALEEHLGIIAASVPCLKAFFTSLTRRMGFNLSKARVNPMHSFGTASPHVTRPKSADIEGEFVQPENSKTPGEMQCSYGSQETITRAKSTGGP